ncbi:MAG TPA: HAD family hydrolase, partial [Bacteroidales bacterium]|nr:HAD family hydrolase [Bacteroidales bacterium]
WMGENYEGIIFCFGRVIINNELSLYEKAFLKLLETPARLQQSYKTFMHIHNAFEIGSIDATAFRNQTRALFGLSKLHDALFDAAWNALLLDIPAHRVALLKSLNPRYRLFLLSNTNEIHYEKYCSDFQKNFPGLSLESLFEDAFFSFMMGLRKPDPEIFRTVIRECVLNPDRTLFIDDTLEHVQAARSCGLHAYHLKPGEEIQSVIGKLLL